MSAKQKDVPETDKQAYELIETFHGEIIRETMRKVYDNFRQLGNNVLDSWIYTLKAYIDANKGYTERSGLEDRKN